MHLIIDGYNLLHVGRLLTQLNSIELQRERDRLIDQLSFYRQLKGCEIIVVFDGWQGGWDTEKRERKQGIDLVFSKLGEKADEVIKRLAKEKGTGAVVVTSDREISRYAGKISIPVISSDQFKERIEISAVTTEKNVELNEEEGWGLRRKGPSRRLSKKERRTRAALKKL